MNVNEIHMCSRTTFPTPSTPIITELPVEEEEEPLNDPIQLTKPQNPKATLGGYPIILERPHLATRNAYIGCRSGDMTISDGKNTRKLVLYPLA